MKMKLFTVRVVQGDFFLFQSVKVSLMLTSALLN